MKVVHYIASLCGGGKERRMLETVKSVSEDENITQYIILFNNNTDYPIPLNKNNIFTIGGQNRLMSIYNLIKILNKIKPDIVHVWSEIHFTLLTFIILKLVMRYRLILGFIADANNYPSFLVKIICLLSYKIADNIVSNSEAGLLAKNAPLDKSVVIYNGFNFERLIKTSKSDIDNFRNEFKIYNRHVISMVARFSDDKDYNMFLEVAARIYRIRKDIIFIGVGKGKNLNRYQSEIKYRELKNVCLVGFRSDIDTIFASSCISVLFTNSKRHLEGVSNSIIEAMAIGIPVVATKGGGTNEIIKDGINGYLVNPSDVDYAIEKILYLINNNDKRSKMGYNAKQTIINNFSIDKAKDNYISLYRITNNH